METAPEAQYLNGPCAGVDSTGRVESFFDSISYNKGGSILRMMRAFLNNRRIGDEPYGLRRSLLQVAALTCCNSSCLLVMFTAECACQPAVHRQSIPAVESHCTTVLPSTVTDMS